MSKWAIPIWILGAIFVGALSLASPPSAAEPADDSSHSLRFEEFSASFLKWYFTVHPVRATQLGIHDHDDALPRLDRREIARVTETLHARLDELGTIDREALSDEAAFDHIILDRAIRAELLELERVRSWQHNPMVYGRILSTGMASLIDRRFAPLERRLELLIGRLEQMPALIHSAKKNLDGVPRLWIEIAARSVRGSAAFLRNDAPRALADQGLAGLDEALVERWERIQPRTIRRLERFADWIERVLPRRAGFDFRLGREVFEHKLLYEEHLSFTVEQLRDLNEQAIADYRRRVEQEARRIDPDRPPAEIMDEITARHPRSDELIATAQEFARQARAFVERHELVSLPAEGFPVIRETPPYARSGFASMSTPGPFETRATESYYNLTNVAADWTEEQRRQHLTYFNYPGLLGITVHEVMPGHWVQLLFRRELPTDVRKVFMPDSFVEGWAHYVEQMMVDEGLGDGDPSVRLGQLRRALQRHARWYAGLAIHAFGETVDDAAERFQDIAYFAAFPALREVQRGTYNPTYLYYALGRMEILRLREDYRRHLESQGKRFSLRDFHDRLLRLGLPIPLARQALIPDPAGPSRR